MNCEHCIEKLPWLLNGTLDREEQSAVQLHLKECTSCAEELDRLEELSELFSPHPSTRMLVHFAERRDGPRNAVMMEHLRSCSACAEKVAQSRGAADLALQLDPELPSLEPSYPGGPFGAKAPEIQPPREEIGWGSARRRISQAAILIAALAAGWFLRPTQPPEIGDVQVVSFTEQIVRSSEGIVEIAIQEGKTDVALQFDMRTVVGELPEVAEFELWTPGTETGRIVEKRLLMRDENHQYIVSIPTELLTAGRYEALLYRPTEEGPELFFSEVIQVQPSQAQQ